MMFNLLIFFTGIFVAIAVIDKIERVIRIRRRHREEQGL